MASIQFKGKVKTLHNMDNSVAYEYISVPEFERKHCDMSAFRRHAKYGAYANSDLFKGMLSKIRREVFCGSPLKLNAVPDGVCVDTGGFLAVVTLDV
jgi:hypothetical protein